MTVLLQCFPFTFHLLFFSKLSFVWALGVLFNLKLWLVVTGLRQRLSVFLAFDLAFHQTAGSQLVLFLWLRPSTYGLHCRFARPVTQ